MDLRPYQNYAAQQIAAYVMAHPRGRLLVVMAPRSGKTPTVASVVRFLALEEGLRSYWVVPRVEVLDATVDHLVGCGVPRDQIGVIYRDRATHTERPFQVASEATLDRRTKPEGVRLVVWDEAHHDGAPRRRRIRACFPGAFHLGITGTPRLLSRGLEEDYDDLIVPVQPSELIHDEYLSVPTVYVPEDKNLPSTKGLRLCRGDYATEALERLVAHDTAVKMVVEDWERLASDLRTVVYAVSVVHSMKLAAAFKARGHAVEHLDGDVKPGPRADMIARLRAGELAGICAVDTISEGVDLPEAKCCVLARPTRSLALYIQQGMRCATPWRGVKPRLLDWAGNCYRLKCLPYDDQAWTLARPLRGRGRDGAGAHGLKRCTCGAVARCSAVKCEACGASFAAEVDAKVRPVEARPLVEMKSTPEQIVKKKAYLEAFAAAKPCVPGWADKVLRAMYGDAAVDAACATVAEG